MSFLAQTGTLVAERYQLLRLIGEGGMGSVWAAMHTATRKQVALKFLKPSVRPETRKRFLREARAASVLRHPNVVPVHDILELPDGTPALVMDLLEGETLAEKLRRVQRVTLGELASILSPVVSAVGTAHAAGIVHRDLKPDNIFLVQLPDEKRDVRVLDFGIAKLTATEGDAAQTSEVTRTGDMVGTPYYMSPEQAFGESDVDHRADIWSLGVIIYESLVGKRPFHGDNMGQILKRIVTGEPVRMAEAAPHVPRDVTQLVDRMLARDRQKRPRDLREVQETLRKYSDERSQSFGEVAGARHVVLGSSDDPMARTTLQVPRTRVVMLIAVSAIIIAAGVLGGWLFARSRKAAEPPGLAAPAAPAPAPPPAHTAPPAPTTSGTAGGAPTGGAPTGGAAPPAAALAGAPAPMPAAPSSSSGGTSAKKGARAARRTAAPTVEAAPAPQPPPKKTLPGGVVEQVPF